MSSESADLQNDGNLNVYDVAITDSYGTSLYAQLVDTIEERSTWIEF